jgi:hypothetical protein
MQRFAIRPASTWKRLYEEDLRPYILILDGATGYQQQIDEIIHLFSTSDEFLSDKKLSAKYLLGYSLQRREFSINKKKEKRDELDTEN